LPSHRRRAILRTVSSTHKKTLDRAMSRAGACSRSEARTAILAGRVQVNGQTVRDPDTWIDIVRDKVLLDGEPLRAVPKEIWLLHKPRGYVTTADDERNRTTVYALLPEGLPWLAPIGRLDLDTSGLLLFTNDSDLANAITDPATKLHKTYVVQCQGRLEDAALRQLATGVALHDGPTRPAKVRRLAEDASTTTLELVIGEGRNRQVRRMIEAIGSHVIALHRTQIGPLQLGAEPEGHARRLTTGEVEALRAAIRTKPGPHRPRTSRGRSR
jgi:23S rRNA pseudouridine2605 synthase